MLNIVRVNHARGTSVQSVHFGTAPSCLDILPGSRDLAHDSIEIPLEYDELIGSEDSTSYGIALFGKSLGDGFMRQIHASQFVLQVLLSSQKWLKRLPTASVRRKV